MKSNLWNGQRRKVKNDQKNMRSLKFWNLVDWTERNARISGNRRITLAQLIISIGLETLIFLRGTLEYLP